MVHTSEFPSVLKLSRILLYKFSNVKGTFKIADIFKTFKNYTKLEKNSAKIASALIRSLIV